MINPSNVVKILADRASNLLPSVFSTNSASTASITNREREAANQLCSVLESIINSHSHTFEVENTLDHRLDDDKLINQVKDENEEDEESLDPEYCGEEDEDRILLKQFSLEYMTPGVNFYDEVNLKTGQRKRQWSTVKHNFYRIPHQNNIARFRRYLERHGTKKQTINQVDDYVFDMFERARGNALPVHDIDLRRWTLKKAMDESLHNSTTSHHWLLTFEYKHNIISRKVTKVRRFIISFQKYS
jgi:hypothetical protein